MNKEEKEARQLCAYSKRLSDCKECAKISFIPISCQEWRLYLGRYRRPRLQIIKDVFKELFKHG